MCTSFCVMEGKRRKAEHTKRAKRFSLLMHTATIICDMNKTLSFLVNNVAND